MFKKVLFVLLATALLAGGLATSAVAKPARNGHGAPLDDPELTPKFMAALEKETKAKEAENGIGEPLGMFRAFALNKYGYQVRPVTNYQQERTYWCGPASARQSLSFHKASSGSGTALPSQTALAGRIGTTESGSTTTRIASALDSYKPTFGSNYNYIASDISDTASPYETFVNRIGTQLRSICLNPTAPVILAQTAYIPRYNGHASRHYMTVSGINDNVSPMVMRDVDPNYNSSYYGVYWDRVGSTTSDGLCRAVYQADLAGSNMAMAW